MSKQGCLHRIKLYRARYELLNPESKQKLKKVFDAKIAEEVENLTKLHNHTFSEDDLNGIVVNIE